MSNQKSGHARLKAAGYRVVQIILTPAEHQRIVLAAEALATDGRRPNLSELVRRAALAESKKILSGRA